MNLSSTKRNAIALGACAVLVAASFVACDSPVAPDPGVAQTTQAVHLAGLFEIDGDALNGPAAGDDWDNVLLGGGGESIANTGVLADPGLLSIFTTGGSKDPNDITQWRHKNGAVPDKDNITNAYAAAYLDGADLIAYFGADRFAQDGDSEIGFWFFKNDVHPKADGTFSGVHAVGDILVLSDFTQGGAIGTIHVYEWVGSGGSDGAINLIDGGTVLGDPAATLFCLPDDTSCAAINKAPTSAPWPYAPKSGAAGTFPVGGFFEGGINVSQLVPGDTCFSSFLAETRSSQSPTATLKDFAIGSFNTCHITVSKSCSVTSLNPEGSPKLFTATFTATVTNSSAAPLPIGTVITIHDDAGTPNDSSDDVTQSITLSSALATGDSVTFPAITFQTDQNPPVNTITATAQFGSTTINSDPSSVTCTPLALNPMLEAHKSCNTELASADGKVVVQVDFSGDVCNTGDVTLAVSAVDSQFGSLVLSDTDLAPGECATFSGSFFPSSADGGVTVPHDAIFSDTVTATGTNAALGSPIVAMVTAHCPLCF